MKDDSYNVGLFKTNPFFIKHLGRKHVLIRNLLLVANGPSDGDLTSTKPTLPFS
jgi:hypothetical protein